MMQCFRVLMPRAFETYTTATFSTSAPYAVDVLPCACGYWWRDLSARQQDLRGQVQSKLPYPTVTACWLSDNISRVHASRLLSSRHDGMQEHVAPLDNHCMSLLHQILI